ncbi:glycine dehydrogenase (aminomethyl-transferring) [Actinobacteria bacterium YIM 96077]|uniref:Glycine dehydrogenase (decarboxylating) n=1 Tax=Phytoactinopolyspora halophila TaxID=1981511 RepID=A0A329R3H2_9ACTN|nr:aminomethyl-transferring glycine dehydrogenase [Phytoactinopolyspora halophila]AYY13245.1 glycine dehydrogenase (aminomethyl-transferring) [Actinobacteria bacterium YIM 96077]RAW17518.1 glycine dehydrogenase (aminomethyl-transferring) [Phytoactinopolyspora halophila]
MSTLPHYQPLSETSAAAPFVARHVGPRDDEIATMLATVGYESLDDLTDAAVPETIRTLSGLDLPEASTEIETLEELRQLSRRNKDQTQMIGLGYHDTVTPPVVIRRVLENPGWYTAYTPYQPEISQGRLEALLNFQTMVADLTGVPTANASLLDEATAAAEAMTLMRRAVRGGPDRIVVDADCLPQTIAVLRTRAEPLGLTVEVADLDAGLPEGELFGLLLQYPGVSGRVRDLSGLISDAHARGALVTVAADLLALTLLVPPGEMGADVVVGSSQRFGVPLGYGGPHAGYMAVRSGLERSLPGRLVGVSVDADGNQAYRLALQTREQHIRRERATSNICTAQVLLAVVASMYAVWHGPEGLREIASRTHRHAATLAAQLRASGVEVVHEAFFDTVLARVPGRAEAVVAEAAELGVNVGLDGSERVRIACDEVTTEADIAVVLKAFGTGLDTGHETGESSWAIPENLQRTSEYLTHPVFNVHRSETSMLRYLRRLQDADYALDRGMIPLGSCTMKLNAATEMEPITWPRFAGVHPFAPIEQAEGYLELVRQLERWLATITGYAAVSLQPNAGSQGELAGLLAIRAYHRSNGDTQRDVCLIPSSAHGTNAASAVMAGMRVVVVASGDDGTVDLDDLRAKLAQHGDRLSAIMVTYPSTHGVYEEGIAEIARLIHEAGGQVYVDGANLNALMGLAKPGEFGADVSHLNLHKTFCIPHGGGGPGVGPIGVREHLAPFLPNHPLLPEAGPATGVGPISAAPFGSASILPISWAYIRMMGAAGLKLATQVAVLTANYVAVRLADHFPVLYTGRNGLVAHECIVDVRPLTRTTGVTVDDVAKRLMDYGFHAPTMSFPVAGTLMIEPTESEDLVELDRFCDAMIAIRKEADRVEAGEWPADDNPLCNAPHTASSLTKDWEHPYSRDLAAFPPPVLRDDKYWPPVRRIDGAYGDRNLVCSCPAPETFQEEGDAD